jgi:cob(I)alamin adenosyltransferase
LSIATQQGDTGQTGLAGGIRLSKADLRVEAYGTVDELNSTLGFARSLCSNAEVKAWTEEIQRTLFRVGAAISTPPESPKRPPEVCAADVEHLTQLVHEIEARPGILSDWSLPGAHTVASAFDVARAVCRRAERCAVRLHEHSVEPNQHTIPYLNRLSDLLWLFARAVELEAGVDSHLRDGAHKGPSWSRAW